ncbi:hypothetical protein Gohar_020125 [Gossypium harknessii]|uniref:RNase H type-1 domain-containing protein n=1 Tax=Gossypium harknessii TaxID=34285 RepID=A0A7J9HZF2_9ROSI|nr:hypothetical protein [Gossypium harknessii]
MSLGKESIFKVETRAMVEGLFIAWEKGFKRIEVECDNALVIELLLAGGGANSSLVEVADYVSKCAAVDFLILQLYEEPLVSIQDLLLADRNVSLPD